MSRHTDSTSRTRRAAARGAALPMVLLLLAVLLMIGGSFLSLSLIERSIATNETFSGKAFNLAEAGVEHARALLPSTDIDALLLAGGNLLSGEALDQGTYSVDVSNNIGPTYPRGVVAADPGGATDDTDAYLVLSSTGNFRTAERGIDVVIERELVPFPYGLYGRDLLRLGGSGEAHVDAGTNGNMEFTGGTPAVVGDADAGGTVTDPSYVTGTSTNGAGPQSFPEVDCPATPFGGVPVGPGVGFDPSTGDINLTGGGDKTFVGGTYYYRDFKMSGSGKLVIPVGHRVDIYLSRELDVQGSGFVNLNGASEFLQIWACGSDSSMWKFSGSDEVWLTIYAPNHPLEMAGSGDKHGSFVAGSLRTSGSAFYYFDAGLQLPTGRYLIVPGTWVESGI